MSKHSPLNTMHCVEESNIILSKNSFQLNGENYLQTHGTAMGIKMAVSFPNIFMANNGNNADTTDRNQAKRMETI